MNSVTFDTEITSVVPDCVYKGNVYEQTVVVELPNDTRIELFDTVPDVLPEDAIGKTGFVTASVLALSDLVSVEEPAKPAIHPLDSKWCYELCGRIVELDMANHGFKEKYPVGGVVLDIGYGTVLVSPDGITQQLTSGSVAIGDFVRIEKGRLDFVSLTVDE